MVLDSAAVVDESPLVLREVEMPQAAANEIRLKVSVCGVCRTDLHIIEGDLDAHLRPIIPGHMIVGRIEQLGKSVTGWKLGQRAGIGWLRHTDGTCKFCRRASENLCPDSLYTGYDANGGYAEYAVVPADFAYALPENFDDLRAAPLLCSGLIGYRALNRTSVPAGGTLLIVGFGSSAHVVIQVAIHRGLKVYVVTRSENHIRQARELGAAWAGDDFEKLPVKADGAVLFAPSGKLVPPTLAALDRGGVCSIAGIHLSDIPELNYQTHLFQERELRSVTANTRQDAYDLLAECEQANISPQVHPYALEEANTALQDVKHSRIEGTAVLVCGS